MRQRQAPVPGEILPGLVTGSSAPYQRLSIWLSLARRRAIRRVSERAMPTLKVSLRRCGLGKPRATLLNIRFAESLQRDATHSNHESRRRRK